MHNETDNKLSVPARYCWRSAFCPQAALLVEADTYYKAARRAILSAREAVYIIGWDMHSATRLLCAADNTAASRDETLRDVLRTAVERNPDLRIYLLLWDWAVLYAHERELVPRINLDWRLPEPVHLALDSNIGIGSSHHQKVVVIDDAVAFAGGLDLTVRRWDRRSHRPDDPDRIDHQGQPYDPYHDIQGCVTGTAASLLGDLARDRWLQATGEALPKPQRTEPADTIIDASDPATLVLNDIHVGIARTVPALESGQAVLEAREALVAMLESARRYVYIENQFICAEVFSDTVVRCLENNPRLEILCITPRTHEGWLESRSMGAERAQMLNRLDRAGVLDRIRFYYPVIRCGGELQDIFVHSKVMVVDDRYCRIGSSNLNNRSMGFDTECDLIFEDAGATGQVEAVRNDLLGEHLGCSAMSVATAVEDKGLLGAVQHLNNDHRGLHPVEEEPAQLSGVEDVLTSLADPEEPVSLGQFLSVVSAEREQAASGRRSRAPLLLVIMALAGFVLLWRYTGLRELTDPAVVSGFLAGLRDTPWTPVILILIYLVAGLVVFPVSVLIIATGIAFGELEGFLYAFAGSMASGLLTYWIGYAHGGAKLVRLAGFRLQSIQARLRRRGMLAVITVRIVPVAPFTIINLAAGVANIPPRAYILGTVIGMLPGIAVMTAFGASAMDLIVNLTWETVLQFFVIVLVWVALIWGTRKYVGMIRRGGRE